LLIFLLSFLSSHASHTSHKQEFDYNYLSNISVLQQSEED
jgi:hypothetical protein